LRICLRRIAYTGLLLFSQKNHSSSDTLARGVQYVHWAMHKCIMVKVGGGNTRTVLENRGKFVKVGGIINFRESEGKCTKTGKIGGNQKFGVDD